MMRGHSRRVRLLMLGVAELLLSGVLHAGESSTPHPADMVLMNGIVYTADRRHPWAQAVAVENGNIVYVGPNAGTKGYAGPQTRIIDLQQTALLPGIIDSHIHPAQGEFYIRRSCNVVSITVNELYSKIEQCAISAPSGEWVVAFGWSGAADEPIMLARLDALLPDRRLLVIAGDSHTAWV